MKAISKAVYFALFSTALALSTAGCKSNPAADNTNTAQNPAQGQGTDQGASQQEDPANANMVPVSNAGSYAQAPAGPAPADTDSSYVPAPSAQAVEQQYPESQYNADSGYGQQAETYAEQPPPELPDYEQPPCPGDGYIWTPGYWNYATAGYYWVPGAWVMAPYTGALWTPGYWGWASNRYAYYPGYWGRHVGYYGGVNYGYGYLGSGYQGGYWHGNQFAYNRTVNNINTRVVRNVYDYHVANVSRSRVSYNGGRGGLQYRPHPTELVAMHEQHNPPMAAQTQMARTAQANRNNFAHVNNGRPATAAVSHPVPADRNVRPPAAVRYAPVQKPVQTRPAEQQRPGQPQQGRPVQTQRPEARPGQPQRPAAAPGQAARPGENRPAPQLAQRPEQHPVQRPAQRPTPQQPARPTQQRPAQTRPAPQRPAQHPVQRPAQRPAQQPARPVQRPAQRPQAQRPAPQRPAARPAPQRPAARPAPARKPEPAQRPEERPR